MDRVAPLGRQATRDLGFYRAGSSHYCRSAGSHCECCGAVAHGIPVDLPERLCAVQQQVLVLFRAICEMVPASRPRQLQCSACNRGEYFSVLPLATLILRLAVML